MKKKLVNHAIEIVTNPNGYKSLPYQYPNGGGGVYVTDAHRILELKEPFDGIDINMRDKKLVQMFERHMHNMTKIGNDYQRYELPTPEYFKQGIRDLVGLKRDAVVWSDGYLTFNARYLYKALEALNAKYCYVGNNYTRDCIYLFENDDLQSWNREAILPIVNNGRTGFWKKVDNEWV